LTWIQGALGVPVLAVKPSAPFALAANLNVSTAQPAVTLFAPIAKSLGTLAPLAATKSNFL
jgi:hypothetical protein